MSKLLKLDGFVSMADAQEYLGKAIGENLSYAEIYQLVLNQDLVVSARFDAHECALLGKYIPFTPEQYVELLSQQQVPEEWSWIDLNHIHYDGDKAQYYAFNPSLTSITGCWDFTMLGAEAVAIDHYFRIQAANSVHGGLCGVELNIPREGILLSNGEQIARLQARTQLDQSIKFDYFLNKLVFKKHEINRFLQSLETQPDGGVKEKSLSGKERNTFLLIINALLAELGICASDKGIAPAIRLITETAGTPISENTIRSILKQICDSAS
ncbi:hypothetical protein I6M33_07410 [Shewanella algae]|uniref:Uncharacterized protein n=1 Tax=Shewanella sedimentimangrovi TaxID=2814293 RepID=A0ABX7QXD6_9GAMM|nr:MULTISPECIES: hypothetical protein [Shewanella]MBO2560448.1 hypothetical protein [Shewanella algae]QSX36182.1 hypothetical protein JYB85_12665 [Shewanella sedimentimangrovi]